MSMLVEILKTPGKYWTKEVLMILIPLLKTIKFFKEREIPDKNYEDIARALGFQQYENNDVIF